MSEVSHIARDQMSDPAKTQGTVMLHSILKILKSGLQGIRNDFAINWCEYNQSR